MHLRRWIYSHTDTTGDNGRSCYACVLGVRAGEVWQGFVEVEIYACCLTAAPDLLAPAAMDVDGTVRGMEYRVMTAERVIP